MRTDFWGKKASGAASAVQEGCSSRVAWHVGPHRGFFPLPGISVAAIIPPSPLGASLLKCSNPASMATRGCCPSATRRG